MNASASESTDLPDGTSLWGDSHHPAVGSGVERSAKDFAGSDGVLARLKRSRSEHESLEILVPSYQLDAPEVVRRKLLVATQRARSWIDQVVTRQLNAIIHSEKFQRLEASWRGLFHLLQTKIAYDWAPTQIHVLNTSWNELKNDLEESVEHEQCALFKRVHDDFIGVPGADPLSVLVLDYEFSNKLAGLMSLRRICAIAKQSLLPVVANASAEVFNLSSFSDLMVRPEAVDLEQLESRPWKQFRKDENSRYLTLAMPKILMRSIIEASPSRSHDYIFHEHCLRSSDYLWGGASWGIGEVLIRNFAEHGWFINMRGMERGIESYGVVHGPTQEYFDNEPNNVSPKSILDTKITDDLERRIGKLGLTVLCCTKFSPSAILYSVPTVNKPDEFLRSETAVNAELSSLLNYVLSACRLGHGVKVMARDWIGGDKSQNVIQTRINEWLLKYQNPSKDASLAARAERPLVDCKAEVTSIPGSPGEFQCRIQLEPFHGMENFAAKLVLETTVLNKEMR